MRKLRHVVILKFKPAATESNIKRVETSFSELHTKINVVQDFEWGINSSPEKLNEGYTHCFMMTFGGDADRDIYIADPNHLAFVEILKLYMENGIVIDYWTK